MGRVVWEGIGLISRLFNNFGILSVSIVFTAREFDGPLPITKALLVAPFVSHRRLLDHLSRKNVTDPNIEKLLVERTDCFANFNARFYDNLCESLNAIQFLVDLEIAAIEGRSLRLIKDLPTDSGLGKRAQKIEKAAPNIAALLNSKSSDLYSSLRIQI